MSKDELIQGEQRVIRPGDTVLVRLSSDMRPEYCLQVAERLRDRLPGVEVLVIAADGIDVYRPDPPGEGGPD